jgi:hypothetical protein
MDDAIHKAIADLSALIKDADSKDAERIREIAELRCPGSNAHLSLS